MEVGKIVDELSGYPPDFNMRFFMTNENGIQIELELFSWEMPVDQEDVIMNLTVREDEEGIDDEYDDVQ